MVSVLPHFLLLHILLAKVQGDADCGPGMRCQKGCVEWSIPKDEKCTRCPLNDDWGTCCADNAVSNICRGDDALYNVGKKWIETAEVGFDIGRTNWLMERLKLHPIYRIFRFACRVCDCKYGGYVGEFICHDGVLDYVQLMKSNDIGSKVTTETAWTYVDYLNIKESSIVFDPPKSNYVDALKDYGMSAEAYHYLSQQPDSPENAYSIRKWLYGGKAEMVFFRNSTNSLRLEVETDKIRPRFSDHFINDLGLLNGALKGTKEEQMTNYTRFVQTFGTHYLQSAEFGCSVFIEKLFNSRSVFRGHSELRKRCLTEAVESCGPRNNKCLSKHIEDCSQEKTNEIFTPFFFGPENCNSFNSSSGPVLIKWTLKDIASLITDRNLEESKDYGFQQGPLDVKGIVGLLERGKKEYCARLSWGFCSGASKVCGFDDTCSFEEVCQIKEQGGYTCSGVGWTEWSGYGPCSVSCGCGVQMKTRECNPQHFNCFGNSVKARPCIMTQCPDASFGNSSTQRPGTSSSYCNKASATFVWALVILVISYGVLH